MTSTTGTDEHPEVAEISALTEGVLSPSRTADVRQHLSACELCEDVRSSLDEIRGLLGTLPGPPRMPADVAGRIEAALAAEALLDSTTPAPDADDSVPVSRETVEPTVDPAAEQVPRETVSITAVPVSRETADRPAGHSRGSGGPGRQTPGPGRSKSRTARVRRWPRALLGAACAAAVIGMGSFLLQTGDVNQAGPDKSRDNQSASVMLGSGSLDTRVHSLLGNSLTYTGKQGKPSENSSPHTNKTLSGSGVATAPSCVQEGIGLSDVSSTLVAEPDTYQGQDVYLVVLPHHGDTTLVDAYVVASSCVTASPSSPGKVLVKQTLPRS
ncbi:hypothetical protein [Streptomyces sp. ISL-11]|uniref:hypothetical protein n=1 Tax=Streptomyces sp. ISL-11 TaxID=2819174 RepID=UPI001BEC5DA0|nr:hypothetical protein [Streptomyces sp. ISL-11]MBT2382772.1 hypothetical protein [Streptomyces sp. ISL-11]